MRQRTPRFWFPKPAFDAPLELQQPYLEISLAAIEQLCQRLAEHVSIEDISLFGFSDSACLALEYMVRCGYPLNAVVALSGVLLGANLDASDRFNLASARTKVLLTIGGAFLQHFACAFGKRNSCSSSLDTKSSRLPANAVRIRFPLPSWK